MTLNKTVEERLSQPHPDPFWDEIQSDDLWDWTQSDDVVDSKRWLDKAVNNPTEAVVPDMDVIKEWHSSRLTPRHLRSRGSRGAKPRTSELRTRLDNANRHFRRKAAAVLRDKEAVLLLATLYKKSNIRLEDFDVCTHGIALAKLSAANFCEIGSESIYITMAGREFIYSIAAS